MEIKDAVREDTQKISGLFSEKQNKKRVIEDTNNFLKNDRKGRYTYSGALLR